MGAAARPLGWADQSTKSGIDRLFVGKIFGNVGGKKNEICASAITGKILAPYAGQFGEIVFAA